MEAVSDLERNEIFEAEKWLGKPSNRDVTAYRNQYCGMRWIKKSSDKKRKQRNVGLSSKFAE
jgi:hypothetical protein